MKTSFCLFTVVLMATLNSAEAQRLSGNQLHEFCDDEALESLCISYIHGVLDMYEHVSASTDIFPEICYPVGATKGQTTDIVRRFMSDNPELRHHPAHFLVTMAVGQTWGCLNQEDE